MAVIERWVTVCPVHGVSFQAYPRPHDRGCYFWSTDDVHCREDVEMVRLTDDRGAVEALRAARDELGRAPVRDHPSPTAKASKIIGDALDRFGGQCAALPRKLVSESGEHSLTDERKEQD